MLSKLWGVAYVIAKPCTEGDLLAQREPRLADNGDFGPLGADAPLAAGQPSAARSEGA